MKHRINIITTLLGSLLVILALFVLDSCKQGKQEQKGETSIEDVKTEMKEAADTTVAYLSEERKDLVEGYENRLDKINNQIEAFEGKMTSAAESAKDSYRARIDKLQSRYAEVQKDLKEFKETSENAWQELNEGLEEAFNELETAVEDAQKEFKSDHSDNEN